MTFCLLKFLQIKKLYHCIVYTRVYFSVCGMFINTGDIKNGPLAVCTRHTEGLHLKDMTYFWQVDMKGGREL